MEFIEYLKEMDKKVMEENGVCRIKTSDDEFFLHSECFSDFQEDFVILHDRRGEVSLVMKYDAIQTLQYMPKEKLDEMRSEVASDLFSKLIKGLDD